MTAAAQFRPSARWKTVDIPCFFMRFDKIIHEKASLLTKALPDIVVYGMIKTDEPRTLDFSGVRGFLVTNVCIVQRSAA